MEALVQLVWRQLSDVVQGVLRSVVGRWRPTSIYWFNSLFLLNALNVKVKKFNQARVNGPVFGAKDRHGRGFYGKGRSSQVCSR